MRHFTLFPVPQICTILAIFVSHSFADDPVIGNTGNGVQRIELLPPGSDNPRNSEGDFVPLKDGRILFVYTHFTGGSGDHAQAHLAGRYSDDHGASWSSQDVLVLPNEAGMNVMSVSLLRLADDKLALFYLRKNSRFDCRPMMRISTDEAESWGKPIEIIPDEQNGYYVLNNDRVVQLGNGRLIVPMSQHYGTDWDEWTSYAQVLCYYSDDGGSTWHRSNDVPSPPPVDGRSVRTQEPGIVALRDDRLMLWARTDGGSQYVAYSQDEGKSWTRFQPSNIISPLSPATIERIPSTGDLLLIWNNHREISPQLAGKRTPLSAAVSQDEGKTWTHIKTIEDAPNGWYCYTAVLFVDDHVLLGHCAGDRKKNNGLAETQITRFPVRWLYSNTDKTGQQ